MIKDFKTYIGEGTLWGNTIMRSDTDKVRKEDVITEEYVRSFIHPGSDVLCKKVTIRKENGRQIVDIEGDFYFKININITEIPFQFGRVTGDFYCNNCEKLTSLEGCPKYVGRFFSCSRCENLTSLKGCPENVGGFNCCGCTKLTSLAGCPNKVRGHFWCMACGKQFTVEEVRKYCDVIKSIRV